MIWYCKKAKRTKRTNKNKNTGQEDRLISAHLSVVPMNRARVWKADKILHGTMIHLHCACKGVAMKMLLYLRGGLLLLIPGESLSPSAAVIPWRNHLKTLQHINKHSAWQARFPWKEPQRKGMNGWSGMFIFGVRRARQECYSSGFGASGTEVFWRCKTHVRCQIHPRLKVRVRDIAHPLGLNLKTPNSARL